VELPRDKDRQSPRDAVAGLLAAASIAASLVGLAYRPARIVPFAAVVALIAAGMSARHSRLAQAAVATAGACFVGGMILAVVTNNPLF
jgi:hypothetical protein